MKKFSLYLSSLLMLLPTFSAEAKVVPPDEAQKKALSFFNSTAKMKRNPAKMNLLWNSLQMSGREDRSGSSDPTFYVYAPESGTGFVIVSAEDAVAPIIGYSFDDPAPASEHLPENLKRWLNAITSDILQIRSRGIQTSEENLIRWRNSHPGNVLKYIETAYWDQGDPYNRQCPMDGGMKSVTGCTSTATSIVMYYHKWPEYSRGITEAYTGGYGVHTPSRDLNHRIDWENMLMQYEPGGFTDVQGEAVAQLMADIGALYQSDYSSDGTGAYEDPWALYVSYGYSPNMRHIQKDYYTFSEWKNLIIEEIEHCGPLVYGGYDDMGNGGHAFVLDGYTDSEFFHFNWGWGGYANGYFSLDMMYPLEGNNTNFNALQEFLQNFRPAENGEEKEEWLTIYEPGLQISEEYITAGTPFDIIDLSVSNLDSEDFLGSVRLAHTDQNGELKTILAEEMISLDNNYAWNFGTATYVINHDVEEGDRIRMFYKENNSANWKLMKGAYPNVAWEIYIKSKTSLLETSSLSYDYQTGKITVRYEDGVHAKLLCDGLEMTNGPQIESRQMILYISFLDPDKKYTLRLEKDSEIREIELNFKSLEN